jgi:hypothetical protein
MVIVCLVTEGGGGGGAGFAAAAAFGLASGPAACGRCAEITPQIKTTSANTISIRLVFLMLFSFSSVVFLFVKR